MNVRNAFAPASRSVPRTALFSRTPFTYIGITGSGASVTLTGCVGLPAAGSALVVGNAAMALGTIGSSRSWVLDNSIAIVGPTGGFTASASIPTNHMDGIYVTGNGAVYPSSVGNFRCNFVYAGDHETFGGQVYLGNAWAQYAPMAPQGINRQNIDSGNQLWMGGIIVGGAAWCVHYICPENGLVGITMQGQSHQGNAPWWMWKAQISV